MKLLLVVMGFLLLNFSVYSADETPPWIMAIGKECVRGCEAIHNRTVTACKARALACCDAGDIHGANICMAEAIQCNKECDECIDLCMELVKAKTREATARIAQELKEEKEREAFQREEEQKFSSNLPSIVSDIAHSIGICTAAGKYSQMFCAFAEYDLDQAMKIYDKLPQGIRDEIPGWFISLATEGVIGSSSYSFPSKVTQLVFRTMEVKTPYGTAVQNVSEGIVSAKLYAANGGTLYKIGKHGIQTTGKDAQFWAVENPIIGGSKPRIDPDFIERYGLPANTQLSDIDWVQRAKIKPGRHEFITREADALAGRKGGAPEVVIGDPDIIETISHVSL